jgi:hypothetical protein
VTTGERAYAVFAVVDGDIQVATVSITGDVPALFVVDALARLELAARRQGWTVRLRKPSEQLRAALRIAGRDAGCSG